MRPPPDIEREIVGLELQGLRILHQAMFRWMHSCNGGGLALPPHQRPMIRQLAEKRADGFFNHVERVLNERIARGSISISGEYDEQRC